MKVNDKVLEILKNENIPAHSIKKTLSGFSNDVYIINDTYVLKHCTRENKLGGLAKEAKILEILQNSTYTTKLVAYNYLSAGEEYLIYEYIKGRTVYSIWHTLNENKRRKILQKTADILKDFHKIDPSLLIDVISQEQKQWSVLVISELYNNLFNLKEKQIADIAGMLEIIPNIKTILEEERRVLVYNDLHFDNLILTDDDKLYLIDFGRVKVLSLDYELQIFSYMCDNPKKFANEKDELNVEPEQFVTASKYLKKFYPELFDFKYFEERQKLYRLMYDLHDCFRTDVRTQLNTQAQLDNFVEFIKNKNRS